MLTIKLRKKHVGFIVRLISDKANYQHLFARLAAAVKANTAAADTDLIPVQCTETEFENMVRDLSLQRAGLVARINKEMKDDVLPQLIAGITAEGQGDEPVLNDDGSPAMRPTSAADDTPVAVTQPKLWARITGALQTSDASDQGDEDRWVSDGLKIAMEP